MHLLYGLLCDHCLLWLSGVSVLWYKIVVIYFWNSIYIILLDLLNVWISDLLQFMGPRYPAGPRPGVRMPQMGNDFNGVSITIFY